ncbi:MAG TPA: hemerythrin domain-containing protein [Natronosporangium sp.]|nr:hemerythrin domain-containing protein [Natronosporangium sp.]
MCDHCGCHAFPAIAALTTQHEQIQDTAGLLRHAIRRGDHHQARRLLAELTDQLTPHVAAEEQGLFAELRHDETIRATVEELCSEHAQLHAALRPPSSSGQPNWQPVLAALDQLRDHIDKEEYGVFPAAVILLPIAAWDRISPREVGTRGDVPRSRVGPGDGGA